MKTPRYNMNLKKSERPVPSRTMIWKSAATICSLQKAGRKEVMS